MPPQAAVQGLVRTVRTELPQDRTPEGDEGWLLGLGFGSTVWGRVWGFRFMGWGLASRFRV